MKTSSLVSGIVLALAVASCGGTDEAADTTTTLAATEVEATDTTTATATGRGGLGSAGLRDRHQTPVPAEYANLTNPVAADEASLARGAELYATCAACHGDTGLGDGTAAAALDPAPVNIAHTSQMMSDAYLFWRISEGGAQFDSAMPAWKDALDEQARWDVINYIQTLSDGTVMAGGGMGMGGGQGTGQGPGANAQAQAVQQAALLEVAVEQGFITQDEADVFDALHPTVDTAMAAARAAASGGTVVTLLPQVLTDLVAAGDLTQDEADTFLSVRTRLSEAGLLP